MNYKQKITTYEHPGKIPSGLHHLNGKSTSNSKFFKKKYPHTTFSCHERLQDFQKAINDIIGSCVLKEDNSYHYKDKKALLNTIKRCLYSRYADNLDDCPGPHGKICNINMLSRTLIDYFEILYKLSIHETINKDERNKLYANDTKRTVKHSIFNALDHFSTINALKKLYIIINYLIANKLRIKEIKYIQNSSNPTNIKTFIIANPSYRPTHDEPDKEYIYHSKNIDYTSVLDDRSFSHNSNKYDIQLLRLYSSVLRVFYSQNFDVTYFDSNNNEHTLSTQFDLFKLNADYLFYNNNTVINPLIPSKLALNSPITSTSPQQIAKSKVLKELNYKYNNTSILDIVGITEQDYSINIRKLYRPLQSIDINDKIPFYLDIFGNGYYNDGYTTTTNNNKKKKAIIKNKIIHLFKEYDSLCRLSNITDAELINIKDTFFYNKIIEHAENAPLSLIDNNIIDPTSLNIPLSLFIKDNPILEEATPSRAHTANSEEHSPLIASILHGRTRPHKRSVKVNQSGILVNQSVASRAPSNSSLMNQSGIFVNESAVSTALSLVNPNSSLVNQPIPLNLGSVNNGLTNNNFSKNFPKLARGNNASTFCKKRVQLLIEKYLLKHTNKMLTTTMTKDTIYSQICKQYAEKKINKNTFIQNLQQYLTKKKIIGI